MAEWQPTPLVEVPSELDTMTLTTVPTVHGPNGIKVRTSPNGKLVSSWPRFEGVADNQLLNMATPNWAGFIENEKMKQVAVETLRTYGVGTCGPAGFYGYLGEHMTTAIHI